jgi:hypothetical protein
MEDTCNSPLRQCFCGNKVRVKDSTVTGCADCLHIATLTSDCLPKWERKYRPGFERLKKTPDESWYANVVAENLRRAGKKKPKKLRFSFKEMNEKLDAYLKRKGIEPLPFVTQRSFEKK